MTSTTTSSSNGEVKTWANKEEFQKYLRATEAEKKREEQENEKQKRAVAHAQNNYSQWKLLTYIDEIKPYGIDPLQVWDELKHCREAKICQRCGYEKKGKKWVEIPGSLDSDEYDLCSKCCKELFA